MPAPALPLICALLRGESPAWPADAGDEAVETFLREARYHGVTPLLDARFRQAGSSCDWPEEFRRACREDAVVQAMRELAHRTELVRVLESFAQAGIAALLMKGTALAYSHYADPALRPRADSDVLVAPRDRDAALRILRDMGYRRISGPAAAHVGYQSEMTRTDGRGETTSVDLHWRVSNAQSFAWLLDFDELAAASVEVPVLASSARRLGDAHALLHALLHRAGNELFVRRGFGDRLIWLHDFRVLADAMADDDLARFVRLARDRQVAAIAIDGLRSCARCLPSPRIAALVAELEAGPGAAAGAALLGAGPLRREWLELAAIPTMRTRIAYLAGRLVPSADYMRERFPESGKRALPLLHARRWLGGLVARGSARGR